MKATLEFDLNDSEDKELHIRAIKATNAYLVIWSYSQDVLRKYRKHGLPEELASLSTQELVEHMEQEFHNTINKYGLDLDSELS